MNLPEQPPTFRQPTPPSARGGGAWRTPPAPRSTSTGELRRPAVRQPGRRRVVGRRDLVRPRRRGRRRGGALRARPPGLRADVAARLTARSAAGPSYPCHGMRADADFAAYLTPAGPPWSAPWSCSAAGRTGPRGRGGRAGPGAPRLGPAAPRRRRRHRRLRALLDAWAARAPDGPAPPMPRGAGVDAGARGQLRCWSGRTSSAALDRDDREAVVLRSSPSCPRTRSPTCSATARGRPPAHRGAQSSTWEPTTRATGRRRRSTSAASVDARRGAPRPTGAAGVVAPRGGGRGRARERRDLRRHAPPSRAPKTTLGAVDVTRVDNPVAGRVVRQRQAAPRPRGRGGARAVTGS